MIIPSIDIMSGKTVRMIRGAEPILLDEEPSSLMKRLSITGRMTVVDMDAALGRGNNRDLLVTFLNKYTCRIGGGIRDRDAAVSWLDAGAEKVIIGTAASTELLKSLPKHRVIAALDVREGEVVVDGARRATGVSALDRIAELRDAAGEILVIAVDREGTLAGIDLGFVQQVVSVAGKGVTVTVGGGVRSPEEIAAIDRMGADVQIGTALQDGTLDLADAILAPAKTDRPDGLWATIVADDAGQALGLVYSDRESVREAVRRQCGAYHSRSRGLWVKGLTSGNVQELIEISLDCDRDALRFVVRQGGEGFCHKHTWTCFGEDKGIARLFRTIQERRESAPKGSYTKRVLEDAGLLRAKLTEEAAELAKAETRAEVISEAADLVYYTLVSLARAGADLADLEKEFHLRSLKVTRRGGDAKQEEG